MREKIGITAEVRGQSPKKVPMLWPYVGLSVAVNGRRSGQCGLWSELQCGYEVYWVMAMWSKLGGPKWMQSRRRCGLIWAQMQALWWVTGLLMWAALKKGSVTPTWVVQLVAQLVAEWAPKWGQWWVAGLSSEWLGSDVREFRLWCGSMLWNVMWSELMRL